MKIFGLKDDSVNQLINDEPVYRTAPATPGLLIRKRRERGHGREECGERNGNEKEVFINKCKYKTNTNMLMFPA